MINNILDLLKFQIINNLFNINFKDIIDYFIYFPIYSILIISFSLIIIYLSNDINYYINYIINYNTKYIILEGKRHFNSNKYYSNYEEFYSIRFRAIWWYINENLNSFNIDSLKEFTTIQSNYNEYGNKINNNNNNNIDNCYIINQKNKFKINKYIYCNILIDKYNYGNNQSDKNIIEDNISIYLIVKNKSLIIIHDFIKKVLLEYQIKLNILRQNKLFIYSLNCDNFKSDNYKSEIQYNWDETEFISNKNFTNIFFKDKNIILEKINNFCNNEELYNKYGIPYHLGILIYGPPGTGKTSFIKAITNYLNRHLIVINMNKIKTNQNLSTIFNEKTYNKLNKNNSINWKNKILLFEDIDCSIDIIKKRKNEYELDSDSDSESTKKIKKFKYIPDNPDKITLGHILNLLDGVKENPGRIIIITTNHKDKIDQALLRPGRIDLCLEFNNINYDILTEMYNYYYKQNIQTIKNLLTINIEKITAAEITNIFKNSITSEDFINTINNYI